MIRLLMALWIGIGYLGTNFGNTLMQLEQPVMEEIYEVSYQETLEDIKNPERGFYTPVYAHFEEEGNSVITPPDDLVHLRIDLSSFSEKEFPRMRYIPWMRL
ncbi:MAG: hypothetical protein J6Z22_04145 [Lachnospiraceae bacterium]|nr:hypothetical protein [Lachnospiraceae bacterium]